MNTITHQSLAQKWADLKVAASGIRIREAAEHLTCSEAELLIAAAATPDLHEDLRVTRLRPQAPEIFALVPSLGRVMALTRNDAVVSETYGEYGEVRATGNVAIVHNGTIDLRVDFSHWHHSFAVTMSSHGRTLHGLHFFDADGTAVHKVYLTEDSDRNAWDALVERFTDPAPPAEVRMVPARPTADTRGGDEVDQARLRDGWAALTNVHQFTALLGRLGINRLAAIRHVGADYASPARSDCHQTVLEAARDGGVPIMAFVRSPGCTQISKGTVSRLARSGGYYTVFDPELHMHIREARLAQAWVVRKPTEHDMVTSVEIYAGDGTLALQLFGVRGDDGREDPQWREIAEAQVSEATMTAG